jgi:hypothetical protein
MSWTKIEPLKSNRINHGCACCSPVAMIAHSDMSIAVGFGSAMLTRDDDLVHDGEQAWQDGCEPWTVAEAEAAALADPDHDWRITMHGPLHGETYQRHEAGRWVLIESNQGFA